MPQGIIELKIGASLHAPTKRFEKDIAAVANDCNRARNAALRKWLRWREDNPDWTPGPRTIRDGSPKLNSKGEPVLEHPCISQAIENELYYAAREAAPHVAAKIMAACRGEVTSWLKGRMPWNHQGAKDRWRALLNYEISPPTWRGFAVPILNQDSVLYYDGKCSKPSLPAPKWESNGDNAVLAFPLFSNDSGREKKGALVRLEVRQLSGGNRALLKRIAGGELKMCDSKIVAKRGGLFFQLSYDVPVKNHGLDKDRVLKVLMNRKDARRPFLLEFPDKTTWMAGDGEPLGKEYERLVARRKGIQKRYQDGGAAKGRGRKRFYRALRPDSRAFRDMQDRFCKHLVADIVAACVKTGCGTVEYREPTMPLREHSWFAERGIPFDWTGFEARLKFKLACNGIDYATGGKGKGPPRMGIGEHQERFGWGKKSKDVG